MYRIVRYCQRFSLFEDLAGVSQVTVNPVKNGSDRTLTTNNHLMLTTSTHYYAPLVHSRTGLSDNDGRTCAAVARQDGYEYLAVVMGSPEYNENGESGVHYRDAKALFKWAFKQFEYKTVLAKSEILASLKVEQAWDIDRVNLVPAKEVATVVDKDMEADHIIRKVTVFETSVLAPIEKGAVYGKVELYVNVDQKIGEVELVAAQTVPHSELLRMWDGFKTTVGKALPLVLGVVGLLILLIVAYILLNIIHNRRRKGVKFRK
jgi:D-alanyl-D-alanine carboxypeptidase (penicillin-binding protein 5/6)